MKTFTKTFELYEFEELSLEAQDKAVSNHVEMDKMQTPWFIGSCIYEYHKEDIIETIKANEYLFFEDGELIPVDYYPT